MKMVEPNGTGFLHSGPSSSTDGASRFELTPDVYITWDDDQEWKDEQAYEGEIDDPIYEVVVNIWHRHSPERIGYLVAQVLFPEGHNKHSFFELCDEHSQDLCEFAEEIKHHRIRLSPFTQDGPLLFPDRFEVLPQWRGQGIGAIVFKFAMYV